MPTPGPVGSGGSVVAVDGLVAEGREADGDVLRPLGVGGAVAHPLALAGDHGLSRAHVEDSPLVLHSEAQRAALSERLGDGFRVALGKNEVFILGIDIAFRGVYSVGGIGTNLWFPEATANGMDTGLLLGFALPKGFEIRLGMDYRRYGFDLNPQPPDPPYVAGGALDQYLGFSFGVAWRR